jgi:hypothetical protein
LLLEIASIFKPNTKIGNLKCCIDRQICEKKTTGRNGGVNNTYKQTKAKMLKFIDYSFKVLINIMSDLFTVF